MVDDYAIIRRLHELLETSDLNVTTEKHIRVEAARREFQIDLSERKQFLRDEIQELPEPEA